MHKKVLMGKFERDHLEYPRLDGRIILKLILKYWDGGEWSGLIWRGLGIGFLKRGKFLD